MNYYSRYPAHYVSKTLHLTMEQDGAYTRLLDWSYANERPIKDEEKFAIARSAKKSEKNAVLFVLSSFFFLTELGWVNARVFDEIKKAAPKLEAARANGLKGGRPPKKEPDGFAENNPVGSSAETQSVNSTKAPQAPSSKDQEQSPPNKSERKSSAVEIDTWIASLDGADAIPPDDTIFSYAKKSGIPMDFLELSWRRFLDDMRSRKTRKKDWRAHYRNAVKSGWYKLWWFSPDGDCRLTTVGEQARRTA